MAALGGTFRVQLNHNNELNQSQLTTELTHSVGKGVSKGERGEEHLDADQEVLISSRDGSRMRFRLAFAVELGKQTHHFEHGQDDA